MTKKPQRRLEVELDWYYIQKETLRKWGLIGVGALLLVAAGVYLYIQGTDQNRRAKSEIAASEKALEEAQRMPEAIRATDELTLARNKIAEARSHLEGRNLQGAINSARESQSISQRILAGYAAAKADAGILDVGGKVEIQRANRTTWESAKPGMQLFEGDFLKTGANGAADVMAADGTLYRIKPETLFEVRRTATLSSPSGQKTRRSEIKMIVGTMNINTGESSRSVVRTDTATTDIGSRSSVGVGVDLSKTTLVATYRGEAVLSNDQGGRLVVGAKEQVTAAGDTKAFGQKQKLPDTPELASPEDNAAFDVRQPGPLILKWKAVRDAARYKLQISQSRLFVPESIVVDLDDRTKPEATAMVKEEGVFFWRVAAIGKANLVSDWSSSRRFRVTSGEIRAGRPDSLPPSLTLERPKVTGTIVFVAGKAEAGASVTVNGELADTDAQGNFRKIIAIHKEGLNTVEVRAADGAGNVSVRRENVYIQIF